MSKISRRTFLWLTGGSGFALATNPPRKMINKLIPQVTPPEYIRPGQWEFFATTCRECPAGCGMHLWYRDGRVTKAEGNPAHPVNRGGLCARGQSALQGLYDPDRVQRVLYRPKGGATRNSSWQEALTALAAQLASGGGRVALLSRLETGSLAEVMKGFAGAFGSSRMLFYEPFNYEPLRAAHQQLYGLPVVPDYRIEKSDFVLSFTADFLETWVSPVSYAYQFSNMHSYRIGEKMNPMAYVGPRLSMTAANADIYLQVPAGYERVTAAAILKIILDRGWAKNDLSAVRGGIDALVAGAGPIPGVDDQKLLTVARAFSAARAPVALAGSMGATGAAATETALLAALLNHACGANGTTVDFSRPHALSATAREAEMEQFLSSLGPEDILFVHETNPVYSRPSAVSRLTRAGTIVYLGTMLDETAQQATWFLPVDYPLEAWGEYQPSPGINGLLQPTMGRMYDTRSAGDIFIELAQRAGKPLSRGPGAAPANFEAWLKGRWSALGAGGGSLLEDPWTFALRNGGVWSGASASAATPAPRLAAVRFSPPPARSTAADQAQLWLWSSLFHFDGRMANRGWLQEAPDPTTFIVWGNWIDLHPAKAKALGIEPRDFVELISAGGTVRAPVRVTEDVDEEVAAIALGQGHRALGRNARGIGANAFVLWALPQDASTFGPVRIRRISSRYPNLITTTAISREQENRDLLQWTPLSDLIKKKAGEGEQLPLPLPEGYTKERDMYPKRGYNKHRWGMVIDLQRCIGCGACAVACYAENNIAVIGKEKVGAGREMAWLRVAPYRRVNSYHFAWLPLPCQHCDAAPCEPVCPVFAAVHNEEGLNAQIYNRCIGTRYCSNNCPYKVRRFNWINIIWDKPLDLQLNPEVTVRGRGVMEKCTFCVQRIRQAEYRAVREKRKVRDGEVLPACVQTCPAKVYTFGDLLDPQSQVVKLMQSDPRRYHLLEELNTKPAVTYLKKVDIDVI